jgi:hypothetical protein
MHMKTADLSSTILLTADSYAKKSSAPSVWGSTQDISPAALSSGNSDSAAWVRRTARKEIICPTENRPDCR